jgi:hypothetical protein
VHLFEGQILKAIGNLEDFVKLDNELAVG